MMINNQKKINLKLNDFEGPLDLLLVLIKENKLDIMNLDINMLVDQYLIFIYEQEDLLVIEQASDYLLMASTLINIKSKKMLQTMNIEVKIEDDLFEIERQKLINQILEYKKYKNIFTKLSQEQDNRNKIFIKEEEDLKELFGNEFEIVERLPNNINPVKLLNSMTNVFNKWIINKFDNQKIIIKELSIEQIEKDIIFIFKSIKNKNKISLSKLLSMVDEIKLTQQYFVTFFCSLLEMVKYQKIILFQDKYDDEIYIKILEKGETNE